MREATRLGAHLRQRRAEKGLSLDDVSGVTKIAPRMLAALEADRHQELPSPVFVRGFIRAYCACVGEPPDRALEMYEAWVRASEPRPGSQGGGSPRRRARSPRRRRWPRVLIAAGLLAAVGGGIWILGPLVGTPGRVRGTVAPLQRSDVEQPAQPGASSELTTPAPAPTESVVGPGEKAPESPALGSAPLPSSAVSRVLVVRAHDTTWVRVRPEDGPVSQEVLQPGSVREWRGTGRFIVTLGDAGGVSLELDGVVLPALGRRGEVVRDVPIPREPGP